MSLWNDSFFQNTNEIVSGFLPWNFLYLTGDFLEAFWGLGLPVGFFVYNITYVVSPQEAPRKLQKNSGQKSRNNFVDILEETVISYGHNKINWPWEDFCKKAGLQLAIGAPRGYSGFEPLTPHCYPRVHGTINGYEYQDKICRLYHSLEMDTCMEAYKPSYLQWNHLNQNLGYPWFL